jgi:hypothetical protein
LIYGLELLRRDADEIAKMLCWVYSHYNVLSLASAALDHFFPKKDMMLPCPGLAAPFFAPLVAGAGVGLAFFAAGSSSEKDSQAASSLVTVRD